MELNNILLGELIEPSYSNNSAEIFDLDSLKGISTGKVFIQTKANMEDVSLKSYLLVQPRQFAFVPDTSRRGDKIALGFNNTKNTILISSIYQVFKVTDIERLLPEYLYIWFCRPEFDRYTRNHSWGSAREVFSYNDMCFISIKLPSLHVQQKAVDAYNALNANLDSYTEGILDIKLTCQAYIEKLAKDYELEQLGKYIYRIDDRNVNKGIKDVMGISILKKFREPKSNVDKDELGSYKIVRPRQIAFVQTTNNEKVFTFGFNNLGKDIVVSSVDEVISVIDENVLIPEYLILWFYRSEFDRYARYHSWGSAREVFTYSDLCKVKIPIPEKSIQQSIVDIYHAQFERQQIAEKLKTVIKEICPVLIRHSLSEQS